MNACEAAHILHRKHFKIVGRVLTEKITPRQVRYKESEFTDPLQEAIESVPLFEEPQPLQLQAVDKLADMLFASDMLLDMLRDERNRVPEHLKAIEPQVQRLYDTINDLMKNLTD
jgi:uncharacterized coiled-coil protein SlyX